MTCVIRFNKPGPGNNINSGFTTCSTELKIVYVMWRRAALDAKIHF
jgi:hypothetical protein